MHTNAYGATAYHPPYYGAAYSTYHPPTTVNYYGSSCPNCGGWNTAGAVAAGAVVGVAAGAAIASANNSAATSNAYASGYAAGSESGYAMGAIYATVPAGCASPRLAGLPTICAAIRGSSRPMVRTASTIAWCQARVADLPDCR